jgi:GMP synthase-like glutamine amidotransferase
MLMKEKSSLSVAILDLYDGHANQGMRCLRELVHDFGAKNEVDIRLDEFEVRMMQEVPDLSYDVYISSGGPGNPLESKGSDWENAYFTWLKQVDDWNNDARNSEKKYVFLICHSFQLVCRELNLATVCKRKSTAFGVFPVHMLPEGKTEKVFEGLRDPFFTVDSRDYQVISPNQEIVRQKGATILALEKERPHVRFERALMAIRFNEYMIGAQFHPEADARGMSMYLQMEDKKNMVIAEHGEQKWESMIVQLNDPDKILWTYSHIIPNFLRLAVTG